MSGATLTSGGWFSRRGRGWLHRVWQDHAKEIGLMEPLSFVEVRVVITLQDHRGQQTFSHSTSPVDISGLSSDGASRPRSEPGDVIQRGWRQSKKNPLRVADVQATDLMRVNPGGDVILRGVSKVQIEAVFEADSLLVPDERSFNAAGVQSEQVLGCNRVEFPSPLRVSSC